jgi:hypothetical protein
MFVLYHTCYKKSILFVNRRQKSNPNPSTQDTAASMDVGAVANVRSCVNRLRIAFGSRCRYGKLVACYLGP